MFGCNEMTEKKADSLSEKEITIADIKFSDLQNKPVLLADQKGKIVFINFWATWCKPCVEEMPSIQRAMEILKNENAEFFFASDEESEQIEQFNEQHKFPFRFVRAENFLQYGIIGLPTTFIFNAEGKLVFSEMGYRRWDEETNIQLIKNFINQK